MPTFYHVTNASVTGDILRYGFRASDPYASMGPGVYLWNTRRWAENYVWDQWMEIGPDGQPRENQYAARGELSRPVIFEIRPSKSGRAKIRPFGEIGDSWHEVASVYEVKGPPENPLYWKTWRWKPPRTAINASYVLDLPRRPIPEAP